MYVYKTTIIEHHDGDTSHVVVDLGFDIQVHATVRWYGINAPELSTPEGKAALVALNQQLPPGTLVTMRTQKDRQEKYGRYLGTFILADGTNVNDWMIQHGLAVTYMV